ncbi:MAG: hypothetical protein JNM93_03105 [Bacteriovoracaceae bacterium]|nr:hypothetical protein [Bacteriovoracaceae bacterium]
MKKKLVFISLSIFIFFFFTSFLLSYFVGKHTNDLRAAIEGRVQTQVKLEKIRVKWSQWGPGLLLEDFEFADKNFKVSELEIRPNWLMSLIMFDFKIAEIKIGQLNFYLNKEDLNISENQVDSESLSLIEIYDRIKNLELKFTVQNSTIIFLEKKAVQNRVSNIKLQLKTELNHIEIKYSFDISYKNNIKGEFSLTKLEDKMVIPHFRLKGPATEMTGRGLFSATAQAATNDDYLSLNIQQLDAVQLVASIQKFWDNSDFLKRWMRLVKNGVLKDGQFEWRGNVRQLGETESLQGHVNVDDVKLKFAPKWPQVEKVAAVITVKNGKLQAKVVSGQTEKVDVVRGLVEYEFKKNILTVDTILKFQGADVPIYLQQTPIWSKINFLGNIIQLENEASMQLRLSLPFDDLDQFTIYGSTLFTPETRLGIFNTNIVLGNLSGGVNFNESGLISGEVEASYGEERFKFKVVTPTLWQLEGVQAGGEFIFDETQNLMKFTHLNLPKIEFKKGKKYKEPAFIKSKPVAVNIEKLNYLGMDFKDVAVIFDRVEQQTSVVHIKKLKSEMFDLQDCQFSTFLGKEMKTDLLCFLKINQLSELLKYQNLTESTIGGKGSIKGKLHWPGKISDFSIATSEGKFDVEWLDFTVIKKTSSKLRKFLDIMTLSFLSATEKDDKINRFAGEVDLKDSVLKTKDFIISLPAMDLYPKGSLLLTDKTLNVRVRIQVNLQKLISVYGLVAMAANPLAALVAASTYIPIIKDFSKPVVGKIFEQEFELKGPAENPQINHLKSANIPIPGK